MDLSRRKNESPFAYHKRLIQGKMTTRELSDCDYAELAELAYGKSYSSDSARKMFYGSARTLELLDEENLRTAKQSSDTNDLDEKVVELKTEQQKFQDQRSAFNKMVRDRAREEELNEIITQAVRNSDLPPLNYTRSSVPASDQTLLVSLNDIHYGIEINNAWNFYNPEICRDMMRGYLNRILDISETHKCDECVVYNCGDAISGNIHQTIQIANRENVVSQVKGVSELISEFLAELSGHFNSVKYVSVSGNHSRIDTKENSSYDERLDDLVDWYLEARLENFENVHICSEARIDPTISAIDVRGQLYVLVHGDYDNSESKLAALQLLVKRPIYAILSGHKHYNKVDSVQGIKTIQSGAFVGTDEFATKKRLFGRPEQIVSLCDNTGIVCYYDVPLR